MDDLPLFGGGYVTELRDLADYHTVPARSPLVYYSPSCGHCRNFAPAYSEWARKLKQAAPETQVYAMNLGEIDPRQASTYNKLFPNAELPRFVPVMSSTASRLEQNVPRVLWSDRDGDKHNEKALTAFYLNNAGKYLSAGSAAAIASAFGLQSENVLEGGATQTKRMSSPRRSPHKKSPKRKSSPKKRAGGGIAKWAEAMKRARKELGIKGFEKVIKGSRLYSATRRIYDSM
jgi:thiol-disulfide isomerase/thioredoxin